MQAPVQALSLLVRPFQSDAQEATVNEVVEQHSSSSSQRHMSSRLPQGSIDSVRAWCTCAKMLQCGGAGLQGRNLRTEQSKARTVAPARGKSAPLDAALSPAPHTLNPTARHCLALCGMGCKTLRVSTSETSLPANRLESDQPSWTCSKVCAAATYSSEFFDTDAVGHAFVSACARSAPGCDHDQSSSQRQAALELRRVVESVDPSSKSFAEGVRRCTFVSEAAAKKSEQLTRFRRTCERARARRASARFKHLNCYQVTF